MSKVVVIPNDMKPNWRCEINNTIYEYEAGSTQSVPDEVADVISNINASKPTQGRGGVNAEAWKFTMEDGSEVTKNVLVEG